MTWPRENHHHQQQQQVLVPLSSARNPESQSGMYTDRYGTEVDEGDEIFDGNFDEHRDMEFDSMPIPQGQIDGFVYFHGKQTRWLSPPRVPRMPAGTRRKTAQLLFSDMEATWSTREQADLFSEKYNFEFEDGRSNFTQKVSAIEQHVSKTPPKRQFTLPSTSSPDVVSDRYDSEGQFVFSQQKDESIAASNAGILGLNSTENDLKSILQQAQNRALLIEESLGQDFQQGDTDDYGSFSSSAHQQHEPTLSDVTSELTSLVKELSQPLS
eukprot:gene337-714_t